ncbi:MAG: serine/threonine protein kinase [Lachnospiraceae bacterium]|nr:serine/threonine protein kinase [Lachnospiraceae bacterium]
MTLEEQAILSYYRPVADIRAEHGISLVQDDRSGKFYVKKCLTVYNAEIFRALQEHPIPGTPKIYAVIEDAGSAVLTVIEEYLPGDSLQELLDTQGVFPEAQVISIALELTSIVHSLRQSVPAIIHRDIKPSNVLLTPDGQVKLLDFNAAKFAASDMQGRDTVLLGTRGFAAPEQYGFAASSVQTDLYAIGVLMNVLLTGKLPAEQMAEGSLSEIIATCTQIDPKNRYASAEALIQALQNNSSPAWQAAGQKSPPAEKGENEETGYNSAHIDADRRQPDSTYIKDDWQQSTPEYTKGERQQAEFRHAKGDWQQSAPEYAKGDRQQANPEYAKGDRQQANPEYVKGDRQLIDSTHAEDDHRQTSSVHAPKTWRRFLPPGFRSGSALHMAAAAIGYFLLIDCTITLQVDTNSRFEVILNQAAFGLAGFGVIFFTCNYLGIQARLPLSRSTKWPVRIAGVLLYDAAIVFGIILVMSLILSFFTG